MAIDQVIDMVTVRHCLVSTARPVDVVGVVMTASMIRRASFRILVTHGNHMLLDGTVSARMMKMPIVKIIGVAVMLDRSMSTASAVLMIVILMSR